MNKTILLTGIALGVLAVVLGAFGAHVLENLVDSARIDTFETGVKYQMYHALFLMILANLKDLPAQRKRLIFQLVAIGVILFSFSIYLLATNGLTTFDFKVIGFVTPIGGLMLILGWIVLGYRCFTHFD